MKEEEIDSKIQGSQCKKFIHKYIQIDMQKGLKICTIRDVSLSLLLVYFSSGVLLKGKLVILLA